MRSSRAISVRASSPSVVKSGYVQKREIVAYWRSSVCSEAAQRLDDRVGVGQDGVLEHLRERRMRVGTRDAQNRRIKKPETLFGDDRREFGANSQRLHGFV